MLAIRGFAHEIRPAYLQIIQTDEQSYEAFWKIPRLDDKVPKISPSFPNQFEVSELSKPKLVLSSAVYSYTFTSEQELRGKTISINGLDKTLIDALVTIQFLNGEKMTFLLQPNKSTFEIPLEASKMNVIKTYTILGIEHILIGIDHLLFVLALIMITAGKWKIIKTVTAFTIAHSVTLSLAALGYVNFPGPPVEAVIALSIVFLALEIIKYHKGEQTLTSQKPWLVAFAFGLLHGFGFAGALADIGLPQQEIPLALAFFNIGVELGQLIFIAFTLVIIFILNFYKSWPKWIKTIPAYAIGSVAFFWLIERIASFWV